MVLYRFIVRRPSPVMAEAFRIPTRKDITPRLIVGSALFGVGWAVAGYCPGPGIVSAGSGGTNALLFLGSMVAGIILFKVVNPLLPSEGGAA